MRLSAEIIEEASRNTAGALSMNGRLEAWWRSNGIDVEAA
jgi:hypothetical protein